jgi:hypothetical protein
MGRTAIGFPGPFLFRGFHVWKREAQEAASLFGPLWVLLSLAVHRTYLPPSPPLWRLGDAWGVVRGGSALLPVAGECAIRPHRCAARVGSGPQLSSRPASSQVRTR